VEEGEDGTIVGHETLKLGASASSLKMSQGSHQNVSRQRSGSASAGKEGIVPVIRCDSFGEGDDKYRLDAEYIQRYLGELSLLEESQLIQLRTWLAHLQKGNVRLCIIKPTQTFNNCDVYRVCIHSDFFFFPDA